MKLLGKIVALGVALAMAIIILVGNATAANAPVHILGIGKNGDPTRVKILVYHSFGYPPAKKESRMATHYRVTPEIFAEQMKYLKDNGYTTVTLGGLISQIKNGQTEFPKEVVLTFDDGWGSQYEYAVPVMEQYGVTATFGIITKNVGRATPTPIVPNPQEANDSKMTWAEIQDLKAHGFEIASHSETHPMLTKATDIALANEIINSKKTLEEKLGAPITTFIYPYYNYDPRVMKAVEDAGYAGARGGFGRFQNTPAHLYQLVAQEVVNDPNPFTTSWY